MLPKPLCFVDIETTGTSLRRDRIIEIGIVRLDEKSEPQTYTTLINPGGYIDPYITSLTGITQDQLEKAPSFYAIKDDVLEFLKDAIFVAHNVRFDYGFLRNEFKRHEISFSTKHFCSVKLARMLYPGHRKYNLDSIIERHNIECKRRHRALDDAQVIAEFYKKILQEKEQNIILKTINSLLKRPSVPLLLSERELDSLPDSPGVYILYGENGLPLYIGKSVNVRNRVLSHFSGDHLSSTEMAISQQVKSIETIPTAGELGALLLESTLIKKHQPLFNRKLRNAYKLIALKQEEKNGFLTATPYTVTEMTSENLEETIGVFRSLKQAKTFLTDIAKAYSLCPKLLSLETGKGSCFSYHLDLCRGACMKKEKSISYNMRFIEAFSRYRIKPWPFKGPIVIKEEGDHKELIVVDKWCVIASVTNEVEPLSGVKSPYSFDNDTYKILLRYLLSKKNTQNILMLDRENLFS